MVFTVGLGIFAYPIVSNYLYERAADSVNNDFDSSVAKITDSEVDERLKLAEAYNALLSGDSDSAALADPYTQEQMDAGLQEYARMLEVGEQIGHVVIPKLALDVPIYAGTSEAVLQKGIGHMEGTSLPIGGNNTHAVLTGHRGLPEAELFTELDELEIGDKFYIKYIGGTLAYQVDQIKVVEPTDLSELSVVQGHDYLTLLTCTPYMVNSHRLLVRAHRIEYVEAVEENEIKESQTNYLYRNLFYATLAVLIIVLLWLLLHYLQNRKKRKR
ncbi:class C sortase [Sedimentibacter sp. SX930]|nr:class C sortase [Sedimentibacter sp. SX930]